MTITIWNTLSTSIEKIYAKHWDKQWILNVNLCSNKARKFQTRNEILQENHCLFLGFWTAKIWENPWVNFRYFLFKLRLWRHLFSINPIAINLIRLLLLKCLVPCLMVLIQTKKSQRHLQIVNLLWLFCERRLAFVFT